MQRLVEEMGRHLCRACARGLCRGDAATDLLGFMSQASDGRDGAGQGSRERLFSPKATINYSEVGTLRGRQPGLRYAKFL
jgi:hypothetical protein